MADETRDQSTEIDVRDAGTVTVRPHEKLAEYLQSRAEVEAQLVREELGKDQMDAIMNASTPEELDAAMKFAGLVALKDIEGGTELRILGYHVAPGTREDIKNNLGVFAVIESVLLDTGQTVNIDTGVERIIAYLRASEVMERFPLDVRVIKQQTGGGNDMITLQPVPRRVVTEAQSA